MSAVQLHSPEISLWGQGTRPLTGACAPLDHH